MALDSHLTVIALTQKGGRLRARVNLNVTSQGNRNVYTIKNN